jgi:hypothetical protein
MNIFEKVKQLERTLESFQNFKKHLAAVVETHKPYLDDEISIEMINEFRASVLKANKRYEKKRDECC